VKISTTEYILDNIRVWISHPDYIRTKNDKRCDDYVRFTTQAINGEHGKCSKESDSKNFSFPYYELILNKPSLIFKNWGALWFPAGAMAYACTTQHLSDEEWEKWHDNDFDWLNGASERISDDFYFKTTQKKFELVSSAECGERGFTFTGSSLGSKLKIICRELDLRD
jgi:hypothetical protein